jgi:hypothetical protein
MLKHKKTSAVFTISRNESFFLPIWLAYYKRYFDEKDIYVLDHDSSDGSTDSMQNCILIHNKLTQNNKWLIDVTCDFQKKLLSRYENVLFTNVDEIIVADPDVYNGLDNFIFSNQENIVACTGYEVIHLLDEPAYDPNFNVLSNRHWYRNTVYDKPLLSKIPLEWAAGWHGLTNFQVPKNPDLFLIHLHRMDYGVCYARHKKTSAEPVYKPDLDDKKWGWHHQVAESEEFKRWFYSIDTARILNAPKGLQLFNSIKNESFENLYKRTLTQVDSIPTKFAVL